jgi:hypothetical protein
MLLIILFAEYEFKHKIISNYQFLISKHGRVGFFGNFDIGHFIRNWKLDIGNFLKPDHLST